MVKFSIDYNLYLLVFILLFLSCNPKSYTKLIVNSNFSNDTTLFYSINEGFSNTNFYLANSKEEKRIIKVVYPLEFRTGNNSFYLIKPDTLTISVNENDLKVRPGKKENIDYSNLIFDLNNKLRYKSYTLYFFDNKNNVLYNSDFINNTLSEEDLAKIEIINNLDLTKFERSDIIKKNLINDFIKIKKISLELFYTNDAFQGSEKSISYKSRINKIMDRIDNLSVDEFLRNACYNDLLVIFWQLTNHSISNNKSIPDINEHIDWVHNNLKKNTLSYQYLIVALKNKADYIQQSKNNNNLKFLPNEIQKSPFYFLLKNYQYNHKDDYELNNKKDHELYDFSDRSYSLPSILSKNKNYPVLIDFWASWCAPCIKQMPSIDSIKKKYPLLKLLQVSVDKNSAYWKKAIMEHKLDQKNSFRININHLPGFYNEISSIPKFALIQKDGALIFYDDLSDIDFEKYLISTTD